MKVPKKRYNLLTLAAALLAATLLAPMNLGTGGGKALAADGGSTAEAQTAASSPSAEALHLLVGRSLVMTYFLQSLKHFSLVLRLG